MAALAAASSVSAASRPTSRSSRPRCQGPQALRLQLAVQAEVEGLLPLLVGDP